MKSPILKAGIICFFILVINKGYSQSKAEWDSKYSECKVAIPLKGTSKHDAADRKLAEKFKDEILIWVHFDKSDKKGGDPRTKRVYLVSETLQNGSQVEYIIAVEDRKAGINAPIFPEWKSRRNRFYNAACVDAK